MIIAEIDYIAGCGSFEDLILGAYLSVAGQLGMKLADIRRLRGLVETEYFPLQTPDDRPLGLYLSFYRSPVHHRPSPACGGPVIMFDNNISFAYNVPRLIY